MAILFYDLATGWLQIVRLARHDKNAIVRAIRFFAGKTRIKRAYSDRGGELVKACDELNILHDHSLPGRPETNSLIERQVQVVTRGARALLSASGLPLAFWPHACHAFCMARNLQPDSLGHTAWTLRGKPAFKGIPPFWKLCYIHTPRHYAGSQASPEVCREIHPRRLPRHGIAVGCLLEKGLLGNTP